MRKLKRIAPPKGDLFYRSLWNAVDGALIDTINCHPDYIPQDRLMACRESILKRVTGTLVSLAEKSAGGGASR